MLIYLVYQYYLVYVRPPQKRNTMWVVISKSYILFCLIKLLSLKKLN